jgi:hypothetical protein
VRPAASAMDGNFTEHLTGYNCGLDRNKR